MYSHNVLAHTPNDLKFGMIFEVGESNGDVNFYKIYLHNYLPHNICEQTLMKYIGKSPKKFKCPNSHFCRFSNFCNIGPEITWL